MWEHFTQLNRLPININKCGKIKFTHKKKPFKIEYNIAGTTLETYEGVKNFGRYFVENMDFSEHLQTTISKANGNLGLLMRHSGELVNTRSLKSLKH